MQSDGNSSRAVIPRWRPLVAIENRDLESTPRFANQAHKHSASDLSAQLKVWRSEGGIAAASDILDAAILTQDNSLMREATASLSDLKSQMPPRIRDALFRALSPKVAPLTQRRLLSNLEKDPNYLHNTIAIYKKRLKEFPKDGISQVEIARLYTVLGQLDEAAHHLHIARLIAPNDRYVSRSTLRFYDVADDLYEGLSIIRRVERLAYDPWVQSAELAATTLLGKESRVPKKPSFQLNHQGTITRSQTELAMAVATRDLSAGSKERKIFNLVRQALPQTTENGFAQAIWLSDNSSRDFEHRFPNLEPGAEAHEANVQLAIDRKDFLTAAGHAELWLEDQSFSHSALIKYLNLRAVQVGPDKTSIEWAKRALLIYSDDWHIMNATLLLLAEAGEFPAADRAFEALRKHAPKGEAQAFVFAAQGFLLFAKGDFADGRNAYMKAIEMARMAKRQDLLLDAAMFWLRCEATNDLVSRSYIESVATTFDQALSKIGRSERNFLDGLWYSIRERILAPAEDEQNDLSEDLSLLNFVKHDLDLEMTPHSPKLPT